jgi:hypothetical protein
MASPENHAKYKRIVDVFMSFIHGRGGEGQEGEYLLDHAYSKEELLRITPVDLIRWLNVKTFGAENPEHNATPLVRASTLDFWKKAISSFMPDRLMQWSVGRNEGNPTRSIEVNSLLKHVRKMEARKQGAESQRRRPMVELEFATMMKVFFDTGIKSKSLIWLYGMRALVNYQFHLMARVDDTTQVVLEHIKVHDKFCNCLKTRLNWSKNVNDERDAPWQVILGSVNSSFCCFISLGLWLEMNLKTNPSASLSPYLFAFSDDISIPLGGLKSKAIVQKIFGQKVFKMEEFKDGGKLGSHSIRKFSATHVRNSGATKDERETRGRWKGKTRVSDIYDDVELPYPDCKMAEKLCFGGACFYLLNPDFDSAALSNIILGLIVPNIRKRLPDSVALVLGSAVLWLIYSCVPDIVPESYKEEMKVKIEEAGVKVEEGINLIIKTPVIISGDQGVVYMDELPLSEPMNFETEQQQTRNSNVIEGRMVNEQVRSGDQLRNWMLAIQSGLLSLRRENMEIKSEMAAMKSTMMSTIERGFGVVNGNIRRVAAQPAQRMGSVQPQLPHEMETLAPATGIRTGTSTGPGPSMMSHPATLMPTPRNLHDLWNEYIFGVGGRKPARLFSMTERGQVKYKYCRRKVVWDLICGLVRQGHSSEAAIDCIYAVYGSGTSVTNIINGLKKDQKNRSLNPTLRF